MFTTVFIAIAGLVLLASLEPTPRQIERSERVRLAQRESRPLTF